MDREPSAFARKEVAPLHRRRPVRDAAYSVVEFLERRCLLSAVPTDTAYIWSHLKPAARHDLAILEYNNPGFEATLDAQLAVLGITPVPAQPGTLPDTGTGRAKNHHPHHHKLNLFHAKPHRHPHRKTGPTPPTVTNANYYYDQALPNQLAFTFDQDVTATSWNSAVTVIDLNTGTTLAASGTYSTALHTIVYDLNASAELSNANYAAILHGSQITDTTNSLSLVGSDSVPGHDFTTTFFFRASDFTHNRATDIFDLNALLANYNTSGKTFSQGDTNYDGSVNITDLNAMVPDYNTSLPLLGSVTATPTSSNGNTRMEIAWGAPADAAVTEFDLYRDSTRIASNVTATSYLDTGLTPGTTYAYLVVSKDAAGDSAWPSPELVTTTPAITSLTVSPPSLSALTVGQTLAFSTPFNDTGSLTTHTANIAWGDGATGTATVVESSNHGTLSAAHVYDNFGAFFGTITVTDPNGSVATDLFEVVVPTFYNTSSGNGFIVGSPYTLTPTFSDPDGSTPLSYYVSWGDGSSAQTYAGSATAFTHGFTSAVGSPYEATVQVLAADGTFTDYPQIPEVPPTLSIAGASGITEGSAYALTASITGSSSGDTYSWEIYWGDDSAPTTFTAAPGVFTHTYSDTGTYTLDALVTDNTSGEGDIQELTTTLADGTPTAGFSTSASITEGVTYAETDTFTDPAGATLDNLTVEWGDGQTDAYYLDPHTLDHTYDAPGTYHGTAIYSYDDGTYVQAFTRTVADAAVTFTAAGGDATLGVTYTLPTQYHDPAGDPLTSYSIAWGDGQTDSFTNNPDQQGTFVHIYNPTTAPSTATVTITGYNAEGGTFAASTTVHVTEPLPTFSFSDTNNAEGGADFHVAATYGAPDNPSFTFSIAWGDGSSGAQAGPTFVHQYSYDTNPASTNEHTFTIIASTDTGWEQTYTDTVKVNAAGSGSGTIDHSGSVTQGITHDYTADFAGGDAGAQVWVISWGDGSVLSYDMTAPGQSTHVVLQHEYTAAGTYHVEADALYTDASYDCQANATDSVSVAAAASPTLTVTGDTTATVTGDTYTLGYSWTSFFDDFVAQWTIDWGDGKSTVYRDGPGEFHHVYSTASNYNISATATTQHGHTYSDGTNLLVAQPGMHAIESDGTTLDHNQQAATGVFVAVDNDDQSDIYTTDGIAVPDDQQTSMSVADSDLVKFAFDAMPSAVGGIYSLSWDTTGFSVWSDQYKDHQIFSGTTFAASGTLAPVYIEGVALNTHMADSAEALVLDWTPAETGPTVEVDAAPINRLNINGPQDVPAYGKYTYKLAGALRAGSVSSWTPSGGTSTPDAAHPEQAAIAWDTPSGGAGAGWIGMVNCTVDGQPMYPRKVYVVDMTIAALPGGAPYFAAPPTVSGSTVHPAFGDKDGRNFQLNEVRAVIVPNAPGILYGLTVVLHGPTVGGITNAGVSEIVGGFVQNVIGFRNHGSYTKPNGTSGGTLTSSVEAMIGAPVSNAPVLDKYEGSLRAWNNSNNIGYSGYFAGFRNGANPTFSHVFIGNDTPGNGPPVTRQKWAGPLGNGNSIPGGSFLLSSMTYEEAFELDFCLQSKQGPLDNYVVRADTVWQMFGDGTVQRQDDNFNFTRTLAGLTVPISGAWTLETSSGLHPSQIKAPTMNDLTGKKETWKPS